MKRITTTAFILAGLAIGSPAILSAQSMPNPTPPTSQPKALDNSETSDSKTMKSQSQASANISDFQRISKDSLDSRTTAKAVIGKPVYGSDGEKLGNIADLTVTQDFEAAHAAHSAMRAEQESPALSSDTASTSSAPAAPRTSDNAWSAAKQMVGLDEPHAIISVGGVLGVGEDFVSVPVSSLQFDPIEQRYTLTVSKAEFEAIAQEKAASYGSSKK